MEDTITCKGCGMTFLNVTIDWSKDPKCKCGTRLLSDGVDNEEKDEHKQLFPDRPAKYSNPHYPDPAGPSHTNEVIIKNINMSFGNMDVFMVKWALAAIPAVIIIALVFAVIFALAGGTLIGIADALKHR